MDAIDAFRKTCAESESSLPERFRSEPGYLLPGKRGMQPLLRCLPAIVQEYMDKVNEKIGTDYKLFNYYGAEDAEHVIIAMGSVCDTIDETIDYLMARGEKVGVVKVRLYRPFVAEALIDAIPETVKRSPFLTEQRSRDLSASRCTWTS